MLESKVCFKTYSLRSLARMSACPSGRAWGSSDKRGWERSWEGESYKKNENIDDIENIENIENIELEARPTREGERDPEEKILTTLEYIAGVAYIYLSNIWTFSN